jgi:hypothetical protein
MTSVVEKTPKVATFSRLCGFIVAVRGWNETSLVDVSVFQCVIAGSADRAGASVAYRNGSTSWHDVSYSVAHRFGTVPD